MPSLKKPFLLQVTECVGGGLLVNFLCNYFSRFAVPVLCVNRRLADCARIKPTVPRTRIQGQTLQQAGKFISD
jgi:hypothetical protein